MEYNYKSPGLMGHNCKRLGFKGRICKEFGLVGHNCKRLGFIMRTCKELGLVRHNCKGLYLMGHNCKRLGFKGRICKGSGSILSPESSFEDRMREQINKKCDPPELAFEGWVESAGSNFLWWIEARKRGLPRRRYV